MAPNSDIIRFSPTPAFAARMLALPALNEAVNRAIDVFDSTKIRNDAMGAALRAAEASMRVAASGALPLATPLVNTVGGWSVVDQWACRGLDQVERVAPIIKKPTKEIVTTTRQNVLKAVAGGEGHGVPDSLSEALTARANQAVIIADFVAKSRGGEIVLNAADQMLATAHVMVDSYLPPVRGDRQGAGVPFGGVSIKVSSLFNKTQQRLHRTVYVLVRPPTDRALDGTITVAMLLSFGRRTVEDIYAEILSDPVEGEPQNPAISMTRSTLKLTRQYTDKLRELLQKQLEATMGMDREVITQFFQNTIQTSVDMTSNAGVYAQGGLNAVMQTIRNVLDNAGNYRTYFEDMLRKAMADYESRDSGAVRAAAAAESWRKKNQMERVASPPPEDYPISSGAISKSPAWQKRMISRQ